MVKVQQRSWSASCLRVILGFGLLATAVNLSQVPAVYAHGDDPVPGSQCSTEGPFGLPRS